MSAPGLMLLPTHVDCPGPADRKKKNSLLYVKGRRNKDYARVQARPRSLPGDTHQFQLEGHVRIPGRWQQGWREGEPSVRFGKKLCIAMGGREG